MLAHIILTIFFGEQKIVIMERKKIFRGEEKEKRV